MRQLCNEARRNDKKASLNSNISSNESVSHESGIKSINLSMSFKNNSNYKEKADDLEEQSNVQGDSLSENSYNYASDINSDDKIETEGDYSSDCSFKNDDDDSQLYDDEMTE